MRLRQYLINITSRKTGAQLNPDILSQFGCCVSDPSGFIVNPAGSRGLAFTDQNGIPINHPVFRHLAFIPELSNGITEEMQITEIIYDKLGSVYQLNKYRDAQVEVVKISTHEK